MSDNGQDRFEIPKDMRSMAEASFEQARKTFEKFVASAQATAGSIEERGATVRAGAKDVSSKAISFAEKNVQASLDYAQSLLKAKDLTEVMRLHSEYVQGQMRALAEQASEMGQIVSRAAMDPPPGTYRHARTDQQVLMSELKEAIGIALDVSADRMYVTDLGGTVYSARLDGSDKRVLLSDQGSLTGIAFVGDR